MHFNNEMYFAMCLRSFFCKTVLFIVFTLLKMRLYFVLCDETVCQDDSNSQQPLHPLLGKTITASDVLGLTWAVDTNL
jgi:hypothetical protein